MDNSLALHQPAFDAYSASTGLDIDEAVGEVYSAWPDAELERLQRSPLGYEHAVRFSLAGEDLMRLHWGGRNGAHVHVQAQGYLSREVAPWVRRFPHKVTRVDSCIDMLTDFDPLYYACSDIAHRLDIKTQMAGDWERGIDGRTYYVGSPTSESRTRLYEKGKQLKRDPDWVRLEVQFRPSKELTRLCCAGLTPEAVWGCAGFTRAIADSVAGLSVPPLPAAKLYRPTDHDRSVRALVKQYGRTLDTMLERLGTPAAVGGELFRLINVAKEEAHHAEQASKSPRTKGQRS